MDRAADGDIIAVLQACRSARDRLIMLLTAPTGLRRGEVLGLRHSDVHLLADSRALGCGIIRPHLMWVRRHRYRAARHGTLRNLVISIFAWSAKPASLPPCGTPREARHAPPACSQDGSNGQ